MKKKKAHRFILDEVMNWKQHISKNGRPLPCAFSRVSEYLGVHFNTVKAWYHGDATPNEYWQRRLESVVNCNLPISRKSRNDIGQKRKVSP